MILVFIFTSCGEAGEASIKLNGDEANLPDELKGLKVYNVNLGKNDYVKVAVLNGKTNSTTYNSGKHKASTIIINKQNNNFIEVSEILVENDSLIVCRK
jgi:hypothetical protein